MNKNNLTHKKRNTIYKILVLVFFALTFIMPDGMQAMPEIDLRIITTAIGIDQVGKDVEVSAQIIIPSEQNGSATKEIIKETAANTQDAIEKMSIQMGRKMELGHCGVIVLGDEFSKLGVEKELGDLLAGANLSPSVNIISTEGTAYDFLNNANKIDDSSSMGLTNYISFANKGIHAPMTTILDFLSNTHSASRTSVLPRLIAKAEEPTGGGEQSQSASSSGGEQSSPKTQSDSKKRKLDSIDTSVVFVDGIKRAELDVEETTGLAWLDPKSIKGQIQTGKVVLDGKEFDKITAYLKNKRVFITPSFKNGTPFIEIKIRVYLQVEDKKKYIFNSENVPELKKKVMETIYDGFKATIKTDIEKAVIKSKATQADIFGFTNKFYQLKYKEFMQYQKENSDKLLSELIVDYKIEINAS